MTDDATRRHLARIDALRAALLQGAGVVSQKVRDAAARNVDVPAPYAGFVDAIHRHAYRITDRTVAELRAAGASEDEVFEMTIAAAYGAAFERFGAGVRALRSVDVAEPGEGS